MVLFTELKLTTLIWLVLEPHNQIYCLWYSIKFFSQTHRYFSLASVLTQKKVHIIISWGRQLSAVSFYSFFSIYYFESEEFKISWFIQTERTTLLETSDMVPSTYIPIFRTQSAIQQTHIWDYMLQRWPTAGWFKIILWTVETFAHNNDNFRSLIVYSFITFKIKILSYNFKCYNCNTHNIKRYTSIKLN